MPRSPWSFCLPLLRASVLHLIYPPVSYLESPGLFLPHKERDPPWGSAKTLELHTSPKVPAESSSFVVNFLSVVLSGPEI